jgi:UDP-glucose 4-epimerase
MRILVTGAGGNLGRVVVPALEQQGHELRLFDFREVPSDHEFVEGDVRDPVAVARAVTGVDAVVHGAALHGIHQGTWSVPEFWSTNATGTFCVYEAARSAGIHRVVLASSMAVYGSRAGRDLGDPGSSEWRVVTEDTPCRPSDVYGMTKVVAEDVARFHADAHGITTVALRLGMFVPETFERYGFRLLFGGVDDRDVAHAVVRALAHDPEDGFAALDIMAAGALTPTDLEDPAVDMATIVDRRWPGTSARVRERGLALTDLVWGRTVFPVDRAVEQLGYRPRFDFSAFLEAWETDDRGHYPYAAEPWWGAERPHW